MSSKNKISKNQIMAIFNNIEKRPKVKNLKGSVIILRIGLIKKLTIPNIPPIKTKTCQYSVSATPKKLLPGKTSKLIPVMNFAARNIDKIPATMYQKSFSICFYYTLSFEQGKNSSLDQFSLSKSKVLLTRQGVLIKIKDN